MAIIVSVMMVSVTVSHEVRHTSIISAAIAFTVRISLVARNMRMTVLIAVVYVWPAMIIEIPVCAFDPIVKTLPLDFSPFLRWRIPTAAILRIGIVMSLLGQAEGLDRGQSCDTEKNSKNGHYYTIESHDSVSFFLAALQGKQATGHGNVPGVEAAGTNPCCSDAVLPGLVAYRSRSSRVVLRLVLSSRYFTMTAA